MHAFMHACMDVCMNVCMYVCIVKTQQLIVVLNVAMPKLCTVLSSNPFVAASAQCCSLYSSRALVLSPEICTCWDNHVAY